MVAEATFFTVHHLIIMHLRQVCCIFTKQVCWTDGVIYMNALRWAGHARRDALIEANDKLLAQ